MSSSDSNYADPNLDLAVLEATPKRKAKILDMAIPSSSQLRPHLPASPHQSYGCPHCRRMNPLAARRSR
jgi:hypothetical protein